MKKCLKHNCFLHHAHLIIAVFPHMSQIGSCSVLKQNATGFLKFMGLVTA